MPRYPRLTSLLFIYLLFSIGATPAWAEDAAPLEDAPISKKVLREVKKISAKIERQVDQKEWKKIVADWDTTLTAAEDYVKAGNYESTQSKQFYQRVNTVSQQAFSAGERTAVEVSEQRKLLETLGPAPREDQVEESVEITKKRALYLAQVSQLDERKAQIQLTLKRAESLAEELSSLRREQSLEFLLAKKPLPLAPATLAQAVPEFLSLTALVSATALKWLDGLRVAISDHIDTLPIILAALAVVVVLFLLRRYLLARFGRDPSQDSPSYSRRAVAALVEVFAQGGIPAAILIGVLLAIDATKELIGEELSVPAEAGFISALIFVLLASFVRTVFSPRLPAWRLIGLTAQHAYLVGSVLIFLIAVYALNAFFARAFDDFTLSEELQSLLAFSFLSVEAICLFAITPKRWWMVLGDDGTTLREPSSIWNFLRRAAAAAMIVTVVAATAGYTELSYYMLANVAKTIVIVALLFSLRAIFHESVSALVRASFLRERLALRIITLQRIKFWFNASVDPLLIVMGGFFIVRIWGVPQEDLLRWAQTAVTGFTVGSITISLVDILSGIALFITGMFLTRALQRTLLKHVMPQVTENVGMHHSIAAGVGYLGLIAALMVGVSALGIDLSNIALIAGALSVGIGFGLQNIVSNFVSGIILIFEQPIKVDDWVIVNGQEGMVKRINFRATEIETFQRASVLIPNADLLANPVTNHTLKDKYGRIEVAVSVAYGTDTKLVEKLLLECATNQQHIVQHPEPFVLFQNFGADGLDFELRCFTNDVLYKMRIASEIRFAVDRAFREADIEIPYQQRVVHFANSPPGIPPASDQPKTT